MEDSIFTKIIKGELPAHRVYEDDKTIAFIPLHPIAKGHVLVVPKVQVDQFFELDDANYLALMSTVKKVASQMNTVLQVKRVGIQVVGLDVPHVHYHVIGFDTLDEFRELPDQTLEPDHAALGAMADKLHFS